MARHEGRRTLTHFLWGTCVLVGVSFASWFFLGYRSACGGRNSFLLHECHARLSVLEAKWVGARVRSTYNLGAAEPAEAAAAAQSGMGGQGVGENSGRLSTEGWMGAVARAGAGGGAGAGTGGAEEGKEVCLIFHEDPSAVEEVYWIMDSLLARLDSHLNVHLRVITDVGAHQGSACTNMLVVSNGKAHDWAKFLEALQQQPAGGEGNGQLLRRSGPPSSSPAQLWFRPPLSSLSDSSSSSTSSFSSPRPSPVRRFGIFMLSDVGPRDTAAVPFADYVLYNYATPEYTARLAQLRKRPSVPLLPLPVGPQWRFGGGAISRAAARRPASLRPVFCSFYGSIEFRPDRAAMAGNPVVQRMCDVVASSSSSSSTTTTTRAFDPGAAYRLALLDSAVTLCPGGQRMEQYRVWETLETGGIPVISVEDGTLQAVLGDGHPLPTVRRRDWKGRGRRGEPGETGPLGAMLDEWARDPRALDRKQREVMQWYATFKTGVQARVAATVLGQEGWRRAA